MSVNEMHRLRARLVALERCSEGEAECEEDCEEFGYGDEVAESCRDAGGACGTAEHHTRGDVAELERRLQRIERVELRNWSAGLPISGAPPHNPRPVVVSHADR